MDNNNTTPENTAVDANKDIEMTPDQIEAAEDEKYMQELNEYVSQLPPPSPEEIALYNEKIDFLKSIHTELKAKFPDFQPDFDPYAIDDDNYTVPKGKYCDHTYKYSPFSNNDDSE